MPKNASLLLQLIIIKAHSILECKLPFNFFSLALLIFELCCGMNKNKAEAVIL